MKYEKFLKSKPENCIFLRENLKKAFVFEYFRQKVNWINLSE